MVAQRFTTLFDIFQVKELLENHGFSDNAQSAIKYSTLIMYKNVRFYNTMSKIDALAKHTIAENIIRMPTLMYAPGMSEDSV